MRRVAVVLGIAAAILAAFVVGFVPLPLYTIGPGPAREVEPLITVDGAPTYQSAGHLVMTTISFRQATPVGALLGWLDPNEAVVGEDVLFPGGESPQQEKRRAISQMDTSKIDAAAVALRELGTYPKRHDPGALIRGVVPGCSAEGRLFPGDLVRAINGRPIPDARAASNVIDDTPSGQGLTFVVRPLGQRETERVRLVRRPCGGSGDPLVGISTLDNFPYRIDIESGDVGGPSAGLMWALGLYDLLTPGDLTGGRTVAGTGTIAPDGTVGPIGGIREKVVAASDIGATVLLVPESELADARAAGVEDVRLVPIGSFHDALRYFNSS
jgi:Lon-like protease